MCGTSWADVFLNGSNDCTVIRDLLLQGFTPVWRLPHRFKQDRNWKVLWHVWYDMFCLMALSHLPATFLSLPVAHWRCIQVRPSNTRQHCYTHLVPWWRILLPAHDTWLRLELAYSSGWVEDEFMMTSTFCARRDVVVMLWCQEGSAGGASFPHQPGGLCFWLT